MVAPHHWFFERPEWEPGVLYDPAGGGHSLVMVVTDGPDVGRFAALVAPDDACILDGHEARNRCFRPPVEPDDYAFAHVGDTITTDGVVRTARLAGGINHFGDGPIGDTVDHYANTGSGFARVRYTHVPEIRAVVALGACDPTVTVWDSLMVRAGALSGDWRMVAELGEFRLAGVQFVNVPGFRPAGAAPTRRSSPFRVRAGLGAGVLLSSFSKETPMETVTLSEGLVSSSPLVVIEAATVTIAGAGAVVEPVRAASCSCQVQAAAVTVEEVQELAQDVADVESIEPEPVADDATLLERIDGIETEIEKLRALIGRFLARSSKAEDVVLVDHET
jgi:hypothetical protein